jgi:glycosyltransferase involved in cell wall biosynthesis
MSNVLIVSNDMVDENMGGVGVRYWEIAHSLAQICKVTLAIPNETKLLSTSVNIVSFDLQHEDLSDLARKADVIILQGFILHFHPYLRDLGIPLAVDLYVPSLLESLVWHDQDDWSSWIPAYEEYLRVQLELLRAGDFFFCASERQRDYWLGWLHAQKRINPHTYRDDPTLRKLIDVVPFGLPENRPPEHHSVLKGIHPGIPADSFLLLWGGGLWDWLDPLTLIQAVVKLVPNHPEIRLFFMGTRHPDSIVSGMKMADQAIALSQQLGLYNQNIFFNDWVPYNERTNYLQEADVGVVTHLEHIETHFSFRTRILDCIWAGLPIVTTQGDALAEEVEKANVGITVPPGDVSALVRAIENMITRGRGGVGLDSWEKLRELFSWKNVVIPLLNFCEHPRIAPDKSLYLTETERISQGKDEFLQKVIHDKDEFLQKVIHDKDEFLQRVIREKDEFFNQVVEQKDQSYQNAAAQTEDHYQQVISQKDNRIKELSEQCERLQSELDRYEQNRIIRVYRRLFMVPKQ